MSQDDSPDYDGYMIHLAEQELEKIDEEEGATPARGPVDAVWRAVAGGDLPIGDMAEWAQIIAKRVVANVLDDKTVADERRRRALRALGLFGVEDRNWEERRAFELYLDFERLAITEKGQPLVSVRRGRRARLLRYMRDCKFYVGCTDEEALKRIDRLDENIPRGG